jgi:hypothetical protein
MKLTDIFESDEDTLSFDQWKKKVKARYPNAVFVNDKGGPGGAYEPSIVAKAPSDISDRDVESEGTLGLYPVKPGPHDICIIYDDDDEMGQLEFGCDGPAH